MTFHSHNEQFNSCTSSEAHPGIFNASPRAPMNCICILAIPLLCAACSVPPVQTASADIPLMLPSSADSGEISVGPIISRVAAENTSVQVQYGWFCQSAPPRTPSLDKLPFSVNDFNRAVIATLEPLNYQLRHAPTSIFESVPPSELTLGGSVTQLRSNVCFPLSGSPYLDRGDTTLAKGSSFIEVKWEIFSATEHRVIFQATAQGRFETKETVQGGLGTIALNAAMSSLRNAASMHEFKDAVTIHRERESAQSGNVVKP